MAGFGFSFPDLTSGLSSLNDIGERFNKIREDIESTLDKTLGAALPADPEQGEDASHVSSRRHLEQDATEHEASVGEDCSRLDDEPATDHPPGSFPQENFHDHGLANRSPTSSSRTGSPAASQPASTAASAAPVPDERAGPGSDEEGWGTPTFPRIEEEDGDNDIRKCNEEEDGNLLKSASGSPEQQQDEVDGEPSEDGEDAADQSVSLPVASQAADTSNAGTSSPPHDQRQEEGTPKKEPLAASATSSVASSPPFVHHSKAERASESPVSDASHRDALVLEDQDEEERKGELAGGLQGPDQAGTIVEEPTVAEPDEAERPVHIDGQIEEQPARDDIPSHVADLTLQDQQQESTPSSSSSSASAPTETPDQASELSRLRETLAVRERQAESGAARLAELTTLVEQLTRKNEELALQKASVSEAELAALEKDFKDRLAAVERKTYAVSKERDALKKALEARSALEQKLKEKDETIAEVLAEGEKLSKKQLAQETSLRKLRTEAREARERADDLNARLSGSQQRVAELAAALSAKGAELAAEREQTAAQLAAERATHAESLQEAQSARDAAEQRAADTARKGAAQQLRGSEARVAVLEESLAELRAEAEAARARAEEKEELMANEVTALQRRCAVAEARSSDADGSILEATRPLLIQIESMQAAAVEEATATSAAREAAEKRLQEAVTESSKLREQLMAVERELKAARVDAERAHALTQEARATMEAVRARADASQQTALEREAEAVRARQEVVSAREALQTMEGLFREQAHSLEARALAAEKRAVQLEETLHKMTSELEQEKKRGGGNTHDAALITTEATPSKKQQSSSEASASFFSPPASTPPENDGTESLKRSLQEAETMRDRLMEELVATATAAELGKAATAEAAKLRAEVDRLSTRCETCLVMLGEKDERIEELVADLSESRALYRQQIEFMADRLADLQKLQA